MKAAHLFVSYLMIFFFLFVSIQQVFCGEYSDYPPHESKHYDHHQHDYHPPAKKSANLDINIPLDFGALAKLGLIGLTQIQLLFALGKIAGAGLGVSALGLGQLGKIGLKIAPVHKGAGIAIDIGGSHHGRQDKSHHYEPVEKHYHIPSEKHY